MKTFLATIAVVLVTAASALAAPQEKGREPFFPHAGSRAYDALHYHVRLVYSRSGTIRAVATMRARARTDLRTVKLDLHGLDVREVKINGGGALVSRGHDKLIAKSADRIKRGQNFKVAIYYSGRPGIVIDPDESEEGWIPTADGALAVGEPQGTMAWLPCDNVPADKASFDAELIVPDGLTAVSNGRLTKVVDEGARRNFKWSEAAPMSTYLAVVDIGRGRLVRQTLAGHPAWTLVDPKLAKHSAKSIGQLAKIIRFESSIYGPYPFEAAGSIVDDAPELGYALETQSRPIYAFAPDLTTVVHETAHQWFGDSVGLKRWPNIWLNEGFAAWTEWFYAERHGGRTAAQIFHKLYEVPASNVGFWEPPSGHPGQAKNLFSTATYVRGAMALEAFRLKVGTGPMLQTLRRWAESHRHRSGDIEEFIALAGRVSGTNVRPLFRRWLFTRGKPGAGSRSNGSSASDAAATAGHRRHRIEPAARVRIGRVWLSAPKSNGGVALLVPVRYPLEFSGRVVRFRIKLRLDGHFFYYASIPVRLGAGPLRTGDTRRSFSFVHRVDLRPDLARESEGGRLQARVRAGGDVDINRDGTPELDSAAETGFQAVLNRAVGGNLCSSVPRISIAPGKRASIPLPACSAAAGWRLEGKPAAGQAAIRNERLVYTAPKRARGAQELVLRNSIASVPVRFTVGAASGAVVRAIGDSVTAGFGYYGDGEPMGILELDGCRPAEPYDDACSSNSEVTSNDQKIIAYADDFGLANNISWAAQWANRYGITDYENLAISGSEPKEWAPGGRLHGVTEGVEAEDPNYVLMTMGANPLLSELLFGVDHMGCAVYSDLFGGFRECAQRAFAEVKLRTTLASLYRDLLAKTSATIYVMQYHLSIPSVALAYSDDQIAEFGKLLNAEIASVAAEVGSSRLQVIAPPHFNVGVNLSPVYASNYRCPGGDEAVDGPSDQSNPTQDELDALHPLSFCPGPVPSGPPWVISGDTGIHPSATGYTQMASRVPAPN